MACLPNILDLAVGRGVVRETTARGESAQWASDYVVQHLQILEVKVIHTVQYLVNGTALSTLLSNPRQTCSFHH